MIGSVYMPWSLYSNAKVPRLSDLVAAIPLYLILFHIYPALVRLGTILWLAGQEK